MRKIVSSFPRVLSLLRKDSRCRDCDELLVSRIWHDEMTQIKGTDYQKQQTALDFLKLYADGEITPADSITRARRKVEELHPELRGKTYERRHNIETKQTIQELKKL